MKDSCYVIFSRRGIDRMAKSNGFQLKPNERAVQVVVEVDDTAFEEPPVPTVYVSVPREALVTEIHAQLETNENTEVHGD